MDSYRNLYESSIAFGIRKAVNADKHKSEMKNKVVSSLETNKLWSASAMNFKIKSTIYEVRLIMQNCHRKKRGR